MIGERHYCVKEVAEMLNLSIDTVQRMFAAEEGVLVISSARSGARRRRGKVTLRIPESVLQRVYSRLERRL
jgi:AraC-like DNA-binding protein